MNILQKELKPLNWNAKAIGAGEVQGRLLSLLSWVQSAHREPVLHCRLFPISIWADLEGGRYSKADELSQEGSSNQPLCTSG